jgi:hypothetical protein
MKKLFTLAAGLLLASTMGMAQPDAKEFVSMQMERFQKEMKMTAEQTPKFEAALTASFEKMMKSFQDGGGDMDAMQATMKKNDEETAKVIKTIVSEEQYKKYEEVRAAMRAEFQQQ